MDMIFSVAAIFLAVIIAFFIFSKFFSKRIENNVLSNIRDSFSAASREALSQNTLHMIHPFSFDCTDALGLSELPSHILSVGERVGFMASGSLSDAIAALRAISARNDGPLSEVPGSGRLMTFVFSRDHIELRQRLGLSVD